jgi:hypothetical protein
MSDPHLDDARESRRRLLKAAAAAGVGIGTFGAPGVSVVPAYGLTNSVVNDKCFFITWKAGSTSWGTNNAETNADSTDGAGLTVTYTWDDPTGKGGSLSVTASGDANTSTGATFTVVENDTGCTFIVSSLTDSKPRSNAPNPDEPCRLAGTERASTYTAGTFADSDDGNNVLIFDLAC